MNGPDFWPYVIAAYAVAIGGTICLVAWSLVSMRRAEARTRGLDRQ
jgi:hypothetical protein